MIPSTSHIIRQQYLHVELNGTESEGLALQRSLSDLCQYRLRLALERVLDRLAPANEYLYIERLEIDAGTLMLERLEQDLAETVAKAVEKSFREPSLPDESLPTTDSDRVQRKTEQQSLHEAFIYFLKTGRLPWSFRLPAGSTLEQVLLNAWQETTTSGVNLRAIKTALLPTLSSVSARKRVLRQFSPAFRAALLAQLSPEAKTAIDAIFLVLRNADAPLSEVKVVEQQLWETAFAAIATGHALTADNLVKETWRALSVPTTQKIGGLLAHYWPDTITRSSGTQDNSTALTPEVPMAEKRLAPLTPSPKLSKRFLPSSESQDEVKEGIYIDCAGLVLLHPFLPHFFAALGIAAEDKLLQPERALCLLHYLATGQQIAPEYELILPKILCNVPLATPVEAQVGLTAVELEEADALLTAVIRHWQALGDTSMDGLRGTFLVRAGKVSLRDDGDWLLQVEAKTFDILLEQLPWGLGMIKLPWMPKMLWVEWR